MLARHLVQEDVLRDQEVEVAEPLLDMVGVRLGLGGVLADEYRALTRSSWSPLIIWSRR